MSVSRDLRELPLFSEFSEAEAKVFAELMEEQEYNEGDVIFDEKTPSCAVFFIFSALRGLQWVI
jgi:CRP-like cAMP-binding protein